VPASKRLLIRLHVPTTVSTRSKRCPGIWSQNWSRGPSSISRVNRLSHSCSGCTSPDEKASPLH